MWRGALYLEKNLAFCGLGHKPWQSLVTSPEGAVELVTPGDIPREAGQLGPGETLSSWVLSSPQRSGGLSRGTPLLVLTLCPQGIQGEALGSLGTSRCR